MDYNEDKVDEITMALLCLVMSGDEKGGQAWKTFETRTLDRLHAKGWIADPKMQSPYVQLTSEGVAMAKALFAKHCHLSCSPFGLTRFRSSSLRDQLQPVEAESQ